MASFLGTKRIWREVFTVEKAVLKTNPIRSYKTGSLLLLQTVLANLDGGGELIERARARVELLLHRRVPEKTTTRLKHVPECLLRSNTPKRCWCVLVRRCCRCIVASAKKPSKGAGSERRARRAASELRGNERRVCASRTRGAAARAPRAPPRAPASAPRRALTSFALAFCLSFLKPFQQICEDVI